LYIKPSVARLTAANPVNLTKSSSINVEGKNGIVTKSSAIIQNNTVLVTLSTVRHIYLIQCHELITCHFQQILDLLHLVALQVTLTIRAIIIIFLHLVASVAAALTVRAVSIMGTTVPTAITKVT
jgi:hypothetical protein